MTSHKLTISIGILIGIIIGFIIAGLLLIYGISEIGNSFQIQNINMTIAINETQLIEAINQSRGMQP